MYRYLIVSFMLIAAVFLYNACSEADDGVGSGDSGTLSIQVTDAPFPVDSIAKAEVTITKIELRHADSTDGSPFVTVFEGSYTFNLIDLRNGVVANLPDVEIPVGTYDLVRIYISDASVELNNTTVYDLKIPSAAASGLKVFVDPAVEVAGGLTTELLLDFDLTKSFVARGNIGRPGFNGFIFKPVLRAVNRTMTGRIGGEVTDTAAVAVAGAQVWAEQDSVVSYTFTDSLGRYALIGLPQGLYDIHATKAGYDTASFSGIQVIPGNLTIQSFVLGNE